jgi:thiamine biosynthesis lipoprotein
MPVMLKRVGPLMLLVLLSFLHCTPGTGRVEHVFQGRTMGTDFSIKIVAPEDTSIDWQSKETAISDLLLEVNREMSTYMEDSEISSFNRFQGADWFAVSSNFARVVQTALQIAQKSDGAFDVTVAPLVNLWGFGPEARPVTVPPDSEIRRRMAHLGYPKLHVRLEPPALRKENGKISCDLSAIAKGFGVDVVADYLNDQAFTDYMVEIGGEVRTRGRNATGQLWRIGVASPDSPDINKILKLDNIAVATSGDYFNYFEEAGIRYSHTIDPRTGRPISHRLASVTVIHRSCMYADGFATAINVLGPEAGYRFAVREELPVYMLVRENSGFVEKMTPKFQEHSKN